MQVPLNDLLFALSRSLDCVERELLGVTSNHGKRTAFLSMQLCRALGMSEADVFDMTTCAVLHDNALTSYMLHAGPGSISRLEGFKAHCSKGEENARSFPFQGDTSGVILQHHENWNGSGFYKMKGEEVLTRAHVLRLADNMDLRLAMGNSRPDLEERMIEHVRTCRETLYAPPVVDAFLGMINARLVHDLSDEHLDAALTAAIPSVKMDISTEQLLRLCKVFATIIDAKSAFTQLHSSGLAEKVRRMAEAYGLDEEHCDKLSVAACLHDVGKLSTPVAILEKPGALTCDEYEIMKDHVVMTWNILKDVRGMEEMTCWSAWHHERLDGTGYPNGYSAEKLPFESRLMACCDVYQALTEDRPYRAGMGHSKAMRILREMADTGKLDPDIVLRIQAVFA